MSKRETANVNECPFKHLTDEQEMGIGVVDGMFQVSCRICGAMGPLSETDHGAVAEWNQRDIVVIDTESFKKLTGAE